MKIQRIAAEYADEKNLRKLCSFLHKQGNEEFAEWETLPKKYLIDRMAIAGFVLDSEIERRLFRI